ncbi:hypothetical protein ACTXT7_007423 [Hymenolepis weldensis]
MEGLSNVDAVKSKISAMNSERERLEKEIADKVEEIENERRKNEAAEAEVAAMTRRIRLLEEDFEQSSGRLTETSTKLDDASKAAEESESARWRLNNQQSADELKITELERSIESATMATQESEWKYEEAARRLAVTEVDLERAEARLETSESPSFAACLFLKTMKRIAIAQQSLAIAHQRAESIESIAKKLEEQLSDVAGKLKAREIAREKVMHEELRIVGNNMKSLEVSEQESLQREESYEETIRDLTERLKTNMELEEYYLKRLEVLREQLKEAEQRAAEAERQVSKLQNEAESRAEIAEAVSKRYEQEIQRVKDTLFSENKTFTLLRKEIDSALDEYHSI